MAEISLSPDGQLQLQIQAANGKWQSHNIPQDESGIAELVRLLTPIAPKVKPKVTYPKWYEIADFLEDQKQKEIEKTSNELGVWLPSLEISL